MTMPHLMNCHHPEESWAWCLDCVKEMYDDNDRLHKEDHQGFLEAHEQVKVLLAECNELRAALKKARAYAVNKQKQHPLGLRGFAAECGVSPTKLSQWTQDRNVGIPDLF